MSQSVQYSFVLMIHRYRTVKFDLFTMNFVGSELFWAHGVCKRQRDDGPG